MRDILLDIASHTAPVIGSAFLALLARSMREAMDADAVLITTGLGAPPTRARSLACWRQNDNLNPVEYDLAGTPCQLVYGGKTVVVARSLYERFPREAGFEGYVGVPMRDGSGKVTGHLALLSKTPLRDGEQAETIVRVFAMRCEAELQRIAHEAEREALIERLSTTNRRLTNRHLELRESNEAKNLLIGMIAHDLRNPLAVILNRSELIASLFSAGSAGQQRRKAEESCEIIAQRAERMDRLISTTLVQVKSGAEAMALDMREFPARRAIEAALALNSVVAGKKGISLVTDTDQALLLRADEDRIIEALDNLIVNAIKYSKAGQRVEVGAALQPDAIELCVRDEGQGLTAEDCARAFRQFQRLSAKPTAGEPSTGLGLSIVRAIAEAHGGTASVASAGRGKGASFTISLPRTLV